MNVLFVSAGLRAGPTCVCMFFYEHMCHVFCFSCEWGYTLHMDMFTAIFLKGECAIYLYTLSAHPWERVLVSIVSGHHPVALCSCSEVSPEELLGAKALQQRPSMLLPAPQRRG